MNRSKIVEAILTEYRQHGPRNQEHILIDSLKYVPDMNLVAFAQEIGIDTDRVLSQNCHTLTCEG